MPSATKARNPNSDNIFVQVSFLGHKNMQFGKYRRGREQVRDPCVIFTKVSEYRCLPGVFPRAENARQRLHKHCTT